MTALNRSFSGEYASAHEPPIGLGLDATFAREDVCAGRVEEENIGASLYEVVECYTVFIIGQEPEGQCECGIWE